MDVMEKRYFRIPPFEPMPDGFVTYLDSLAWACEMTHLYGGHEVYEVTPTGAIRLVAVMAVVR